MSTLSLKARLLERLAGRHSNASATPGGAGSRGPEPFYLPDLTLWYDWHSRQNTLPAEWQDHSLPEIARDMGVPIWLPVRPWRVETPGVEVILTEGPEKRTIRSETSAGVLQARWTLGPDGDWWQTEYPVKTKGDLPAALELARSRIYVLDPGVLATARADVGHDGLVALEIPRRPYSDLLHDFLGWSEGLTLLGEPAVSEMLQTLEEKLQELVRKIAQLSGEVVLSPDNLDGQYISPRMFDKSLAGSYRRTAETLHQRGMRLLVHVGGPIRHLLHALYQAGVDGIEGIAGPPQSNATLAEARAVAGPELTLWGGIPQDLLLETHEPEAFLANVERAVQEAQGDALMIVGVADRVPVDADLGRLKALPALIEQYR
jgi:hypothetical protein